MERAKRLEWSSLDDGLRKGAIMSLDCTDLVDDLNRLRDIARGVAYSFRGVGHATGTSREMEGSSELADILIEQLEALSEKVENSGKTEQP